jgi:hypothetical protein
VITERTLMNDREQSDWYVSLNTPLLTEMHPLAITCANAMP